MKTKFLITGSSGMLGSSLVEHFKKKKIKFLSPNSYELNLLNASSIEKYLKKNKPDYIIHLAGYVGGIGANIQDPIKFLNINIMMGMNLIDVALKMKIKNFLNIGSSCIYPSNEKKKIKEKKLLSNKLEKTNEGYALAKISVIKMCEYIAKSKKYNYFSLIPCNIYGPNDKFNIKKGHVMGSLIYKIYEAKKNKINSVEVWGNGKSRREFIYVDDVSKAIIKFLNNKKLIEKKIYWLNIGTGTDYSISELARKIVKEVGYKGKLVQNLNKPSGVYRKLLNIELAKSFGWQPKINLETGLRKTIKHYKKNSI